MNSPKTKILPVYCSSVIVGQTTGGYFNNNLMPILFFAVLFIIISFTYLSAAGNLNKVTKTKNKLSYVIVAIIIAFLAAGFEMIVKNF